MAQASNTFKSLVDLLIREQFTQSCSTDMALFLKERAPKSVAKMTKLAKQYLEAHGGNIMSTKPLTNMRPHRGPRSVRPSPPTAGFRPFVRGSSQPPPRLAEMPKKVEVTNKICHVCGILLMSAEIFNPKRKLLHLAFRVAWREVTSGEDLRVSCREIGGERG